jgi:prepilin-type N-terminal cleavage/methylation domain-containing protein
VSPTRRRGRPARRLAHRDERGFTLVEVLAAMIVFAIAATAVTTMFAAGLRASLMTKMDTTAKNLSQQRFEQVRNLPFHIDQVSSGTNPPDLLDTYYVATSGSSVGRGVQGFVASGATRYTADGDPATGAFYRYVQSPVPGFPKFKQYVATQFLDDTGAAYNPSSFSALVYGSDTPPTTTVGVGVTTIWTAGKLSRTARSYTQLTSGRPAAPSAVLQSQLTALRLTGGISGGLTLTMDLASLSADGGVSETVTAASALRAASLTLSSGPSVSGATTTRQAPPNQAAASDTGSSQTLVNGGVTLGSFGNTTTTNVAAASSTGQPVLGLSSAQEKADVLGSGGGTKVASFAIDSSGPARLGLTTTHAYVEDAGCGGSCSNVGVSGYASTTGTSTHNSTTSASATVKGALVLLPTTFAPNGLVRVTLTSANVSCTVSRTGTATPVGSVTITYAGSLSYYAPSDPASVGGYRTVALSSSQTSSPLTADLLAATRVATDSAGVPLYLSDYFQSWSSMTTSSIAGAKTVNAAGTVAEASFSGMIGVTSVPLRDGDPLSVVAAEVGVGTCDAEDYR